MAEITFTGAVLNSFSRDHNGGTAQFTANLTLPVCKAMSWLDKAGNPAVADFLTGAKPDGELHATGMTLRSKEGDLAQYEIEFSVSKVHSFNFVRRELEGARGKGHRFELRFKVDFADLTGARYLEEYMVSAGDSKGTLTVRHDPKAKQDELPLDTVTATEEQRQAALEIQ